jgi:hypothetical protein
VEAEIHKHTSAISKLRATIDGWKGNKEAKTQLFDPLVPEAAKDIIRQEIKLLSEEVMTHMQHLKGLYPAAYSQWERHQI